MRALANKKHEKFAHAVIENDGDKNLAYQSVYKGVSKECARVSSYALLSRPEILSRIRSLLSESGVSLPKLVEKHKRLLRHNDMIGFNALKLGYQLHGAFEEDDEEKTANAIEININIAQVSA